MVGGDRNLLSRRLAQWLKAQVGGAGAKGFVVGLSGGIDSGVTAALCRLAAPQAVLGLIMPCQSKKEDQKDAQLLAQQLQIPTIFVPLNNIYQLFLTTIYHTAPPGLGGTRLAEANLKPRLRMMTLYFWANSLNYLVVGTGNRSELETGYFTKYGDGGADLLPLGGLVKSQVFDLARELSLPEQIIAKPPSAGLRPDQTDEDDLGISYRELDLFLITGQGSGKTRDLVSQLQARSEHKRRLPLIPPPEVVGI